MAELHTRYGGEMKGMVLPVATPLVVAEAPEIEPHGLSPGRSSAWQEDYLSTTDWDRLLLIPTPLSNHESTGRL